MISETVPLIGGNGIKMTIIMEELTKPEVAENPT